MKLSIVTITYNNFLELKTTLDTISGILNTESVIINGGKCQDTLAFLKEHDELVSRSEPDEGISDAFNKGLKLATGDFI
ncbi:MAG: glycosyltransferase, partial [Bacteriovorax sp.]|nr:glycosyltransferase [Bacteriovorax sp.]